MSERTTGLRAATTAWAHIGRAITLGAVAGFFTLGLGGRLAMFAFAEQTGRPGVWTMRGTANVALSGSIAGAIAAILLTLVQRWTFPRAHVVVRGLVAGALTLLLLSPGIRPPRPLTFALFTPTFLAFGVLFHWLWTRHQHANTRAGDVGTGQTT